MNDYDDWEVIWSPSTGKRVSSIQFNEGLRISIDKTGLLIEVIDYHAHPLNLSWAQLRDFAVSAGLGAEQIPYPSTRKR